MDSKSANIKIPLRHKNFCTHIYFELHPSPLHALLLHSPSNINFSSGEWKLFSFEVKNQISCHNMDLASFFMIQNVCKYSYKSEIFRIMYSEIVSS